MEEVRLNYRPALAADALCIGVLATQVFLDTYATAGIRADLAREVLAGCSPEVFAPRLAMPSLEFTLAETNGSLVGFSELNLLSVCPVHPAAAVEVVRLYVQRPFQRRGIGRELLQRAEQSALAAGSQTLWLSAWSENDRALAFYAANGYADIGASSYVFEDRTYENRVLLRSLTRSRTDSPRTT